MIELNAVVRFITCYRLFCEEDMILAIHVSLLISTTIIVDPLNFTKRILKDKRATRMAKRM